VLSNFLLLLRPFCKLCVSARASANYWSKMQSRVHAFEKGTQRAPRPSAPDPIGLADEEPQGSEGSRTVSRASSAASLTELGSSGTGIPSPDDSKPQGMATQGVSVGGTVSQSTRTVQQKATRLVTVIAMAILLLSARTSGLVPLLLACSNIWREEPVSQTLVFVLGHTISIAAALQCVSYLLVFPVYRRRISAVAGCGHRHKVAPGDFHPRADATPTLPSPTGSSPSGSMIGLSSHRGVAIAIRSPPPSADT
jgi:hypothetical protein